ncbi:hypothetical protein BCV70DRAFT_162460 [Testicularia cyperi]|uniref:DUF2415 domain-containing protein n=1 Tax=Testicularia cyperi TaxID=1882483 RepID=A0A317XM27_9BASI|nr:hypothetical protein BCV70DRAFT_162460 [Testicularia cyperi]
MTRGPEHIDETPKIIPARVNIHHLQLRDLLQPTGVKDKVVFVSRLKVEQADFSTLKAPSVYCTLDFQPNCIATGCGLLATGGQHGELALRPLHSPLSAAIANSNSGGQDDRPPAPWLLRTPTGGSINNAISIQHDPNLPPPSQLSRTASIHRKQKQDVVDSSNEHHTSSSSSRRAAVPWHRDEPSNIPVVARPGLLFGDEEMESELSESVFQELAAAYGFDPSSVNRSSRYRRPSDSRQRLGSGRSLSPTKQAVDPLLAPIKVMVSNNDQSVKMYKLRPPKSTPGAGGRIESGLPGLSRNMTLHFPTAINHSSLSPDQRTLLAVGDTPDVFIHHVARSGEHTKVATYSASSDACFGTTWSPDGSKFAVASQDGIVSVWDVRSSHKLAQLSTSQASMTSGNGAARVAKFSPCGRFLAFTEHRNYFHITDTITFSETQKILSPPSTSTPGGTGRRIPISDTTRFEPGEGFRYLSGGEDPVSRDRERRSIMHATFMREWNRAINQVDLGVGPSISAASVTAAAAAAATNADLEMLLGSSNSTSSGSAPGESSINISGLCWDPDGEALFVSTERLVARYSVNDPRTSSSSATFL